MSAQSSRRLGIASSLGFMHTVGNQKLEVSVVIAQAGHPGAPATALVMNQMLSMQKAPQDQPVNRLRQSQPEQLVQFVLEI